MLLNWLISFTDWSAATERYFWTGCDNRVVENYLVSGGATVVSSGLNQFAIGNFKIEATGTYRVLVTLLAGERPVRRVEGMVSIPDLSVDISGTGLPTSILGSDLKVSLSDQQNIWLYTADTQTLTVRAYLGSPQSDSIDRVRVSVVSGSSPVYRGVGSVLEVSGLSNSTTGVEDRLTVSLNVAQMSRRQQFLIDPGPIPIQLSLVSSIDGGLTWRRLPRQFTGRLSSPQITSGVLTVQVETYGGDIDRVEPKQIAHDTQVTEYPGDRGLEYMASLATGLEVRWPP